MTHNLAYLRGPEQILLLLPQLQHCHAKFLMFRECKPRLVTLPVVRKHP